MNLAKNKVRMLLFIDPGQEQVRMMLLTKCPVNQAKNNVRMVLFSEPGQKQDKDGMYVLFSELGQEHCEDGIAQVTGDPLPNLRNSNLFVIHITVS